MTKSETSLNFIRRLNRGVCLKEAQQIVSKLEAKEPVLMDTTNLEYAVQKWSVEDLKFANSVVVSELNHRSRQKAHEALSKFHIGEQVSFTTKRGQLVQGTITKINSKSVSLENCSDGKGWRVHANHLQKVV